jgi:hypothetical protein
MNDAEQDPQDPQVPRVQQDQVGRPAERAEELRRAASSRQGADDSALTGADDWEPTDDSPTEPAAPAAPPGVFDRDASANLTTTEGESGQRDGEWEADAEGVVQHTSSGSEEPADENPERPR